MAEFTLAIICGGKSSRMGTNKAFVEIEGTPMIERIIERTQGLGQQETILVTNAPTEYAHLDLPMYLDVIPECGALGGIYTAIYHSKTTHTMVIACDMPFVSADVIHVMMRDVSDYDVVVPTVKGYPQGLHALYSKNCLEPIRAKLNQKQLKVIGFYEQVNVKYLDEDTLRAVNPDGLALMNVNTPDDLEHARRIALGSDLIGLRRGIVRLLPHQEAWKKAYEIEKERLASELKDEIIAIEHVGSTAIPNIPAKPIIDIAIAMPSLDNALDLKPILESIGYQYRPAHDGGRKEGQDTYALGEEIARTHYLHVVEYGGEEWQNYLCFRDTLRNNPDLARDYADIKRTLARQFPEKRYDYTDGKANFIQRVLEQCR